MSNDAISKKPRIGLVAVFLNGFSSNLLCLRGKQIQFMIIVSWFRLVQKIMSYMGKSDPFNFDRFMQPISDQLHNSFQLEYIIMIPCIN